MKNIISRIRTSAFTVGAYTDGIYESITSEDGANISEKTLRSVISDLNVIERSLLQSFSEILIPQELIEYASGNISGRPEPLPDFAERMSRSLQSVADSAGKTKLKISHFCEEGLVGRFRAYTLELLIAGMLGWIFEKYPSCKYFKLFIKGTTESGRRMISINALASNNPDISEDIILFGQTERFGGSGLSVMYDALLACFCTEFGCRHYHIDQPGTKVLGILMPFCTDEPDHLAMAKEKLSENTRFSCSRAMLAGSIFGGKYKYSK